MKKIIFGILFLSLYSIPTIAQDSPAPSPASTISQKVGLTDVSISYSRPGLKGRDMYETLTPEGKIWRTGANAGTKITFSTDVKVEGKDIPAGTYTFYTIPGKSEWNVMLYTDNSLGGQVGNYDESKELSKFTVKPVNISPKVETMTFGINDISKESTSATIVFMWENTSWKLNLEVPKTW